MRCMVLKNHFAKEKWSEKNKERDHNHNNIITLLWPPGNTHFSHTFGQKNHMQHQPEQPTIHSIYTKREFQINSYHIPTKYSQAKKMEEVEF